MREVADEIVWDCRLPVLTNLFLWYDLTKVFLIVYLIVVALMGLVFVMAGEPASVVGIARVFAIVCAALVVFSMVVATVRYLNRIDIRFGLSREGVRYQTVERGDSVLNRLAIALGLLLGRPAAAGAGLLAEARRSEFTPWKQVTRVREHDALHVVTLMNGWRVVQRLHCRRDDYRRIVDYVRDRLDRREPEPDGAQGRQARGR